MAQLIGKATQQIILFEKLHKYWSNSKFTKEEFEKWVDENVQISSPESPTVPMVDTQIIEKVESVVTPIEGGNIIYGLFDPNDGMCRYVGSTTDLKTRIEKHEECKNVSNPELNDWLTSLVKNHQTPDVFVFTSVSDDDNDWVERMWIAYMKREHPLLNIHRGGINEIYQYSNGKNKRTHSGTYYGEIRYVNIDGTKIQIIVDLYDIKNTNVFIRKHKEFFDMSKKWNKERLEKILKTFKLRNPESLVRHKVELKVDSFKSFATFKRWK